MHGLVGKILRVDLEKRRISEDELSEEAGRKFFGGRGLGAKILYEEVAAHTDPFDKRNKLILAIGAVTGAPFAGHSRHAFMAKSPLTGIFGEAHAAAYFGPELRYAGYDAVIVENKSTTPVYLWIHDGESELRDARSLWGKVTGEVQKRIRNELGDEKIRVASIGPGGENLVKYACIISDLYSAAGRCGLGAVMGDKKLKAIAVRGTQPTKIYDEEKFRRAAKKLAKDLMEDTGEDLRQGGTSRIVDDLHATGRLPTKAFRKCSFEGADDITGETMAETILVKRETCPACPAAHYRVVEAHEPYQVDPAYGGPEYETCAALGSLCMNDDLVSISKANELCNKYTIDTISAGVCIAFAMECYENGLLTDADTDGIDLTWGNAETIVQLVEKIGKREGIGDLLAEGVMRAAKKIGKGAEKFALHIKGMELPMHEPRGKKGLGLSYAVSNVGANHMRIPHDDFFEKEDKLAPEIGLTPDLAPRHRLYAGPEKAKLVKITEDLNAMRDSLIVCKFTTYPRGPSFSTLNDIVSSITGWDLTPKEMMTVGERTVNLCRAFNVREGLTRKDDTLPQRLMEPLPEGLYKGEAISPDVLDKMPDHYYDERGWDKATGIPTQEKLEELGLGYVADEMKS